MEGNILKSDMPEYEIWCGIKKRCLNKKNVAYPNYGGRGITVCDRWINSFDNFFADIGNRPSSDLSLDRIDNDGNYEPGNVRWATRLQQSQNRRSRRRTLSCMNCTKEFTRPNHRPVGTEIYCSKPCRDSFRSVHYVVPIVHGTETAYMNKGCRCNPCKDANKEARKRRKLAN